MKNENLPKGINILGLKTRERRTTSRGRTPIDTYPPTVEIPISNRVLTPEAPVREKELAPPPTPEEAAKANQGTYAGSTRTVEKVGGNKLLKVALGATGIVAGGAIAYENVPAVHQAVDSAFLDHIKGKSLSTEISTNSEVFDNSVTKGIITEKNTIQMTREEYAKIAPPTIDRSNVKEVPVEYKLFDGGTRKLTFERGTSVNAMIYIKTPEGTIRELTYTKIVNPGQVTGTEDPDVSFTNCREFLGADNEIKAGDIFPSPISGFASYNATPIKYYKGEKLEEGSAKSASYDIEGEYLDEKGNKFRTHANIHTLGYSGSAITKALVPGIPNSDDFAEGDSRTTGSFINTDKLKKASVKINQGDNLFKFITPPPFQDFTSNSKKKSQVMVTISYEGDFGENGIANTFGGEDCNHPTLDNKAIVLK